jgi:hypothetical protein
LFLISTAKVQNNCQIQTTNEQEFINKNKKDSVLNCSFALCFPVFIVCEVVNQSALNEFCNVFFGGFIWDLQTLGGSQVVLSRK